MHEKSLTVVQTSRPRQSTPPRQVHTPGHIDCPACELARTQMLEPGALASLSFTEAASVWFNSHTLHVDVGTVRHYRNCIRALTAFFGQLRLGQIHIGHFEQYQRMRTSGEGLGKAGPSCINHELNTLSQILTRANLWAPLADNYKPLRLPRPKVGCAMAQEQEERLFRVASSNPRWKITYCCALITANTTAGPNEIRHLTLGDIDLDPPAIRITEGVKNEYRRRTIPLNQPAAWAIRELVKRARELGAVDPRHYVLPHRACNGKKGFDLNRPISSWRGSWDKLRKAAGLPQLRLYDLRHHAITRLLEDENVSERTVIELAGHVSRQMLERYSHIRMRTKQEAVEALAKKGSQPTGKMGLMLVKK
jgi:integrase